MVLEGGIVQRGMVKGIDGKEWRGYRPRQRVGVEIGAGGVWHKRMMAKRGKVQRGNRWPPRGGALVRS